MAQQLSASPWYYDSVSSVIFRNVRVQSNRGLRFTLSESNMCCSSHVCRVFWNFHSLRFWAQLHWQSDDRLRVWVKWQEAAGVSDDNGISEDQHQENSHDKQQEMLCWVLSQLNAVLLSQKHNKMAGNTFGVVLLHRHSHLTVLLRGPFMWPHRVRMRKHGQANEAETENVPCFKKLFSPSFLRKSEWHHWAVAETENHARTSLTKWDNPKPAEVQWAQTALFSGQSFLPL